MLLGQYDTNCTIIKSSFVQNALTVTLNNTVLSGTYLSQGEKLEKYVKIPTKSELYKRNLLLPAVMWLYKTLVLFSLYRVNKYWEYISRVCSDAHRRSCCAVVLVDGSHSLHCKDLPSNDDGIIGP